MKVFETQHIKNVVLLGSTKSGKTTLAETMMFEGGVLSRRGSVEEGNTASDFTDLEKEKGYSIYSSLLHTVWRDTKINIIDTPGNDNFIGEILQGLRAADAAILVLNAQHGVEIGTEIIWRYLKESGLPVILVANQVDHEKANFDKLLEEAKSRFGNAVIPMQFPYNQGDGFDTIVDLLKMTTYKFGADGGKPEKVAIPDDVRNKADEWHNELVEAAAENDEDLMEKYFEQGELDEDDMRDGLRKGMSAGDVYPLFVVSSKRNMGSGRMMGFIGNVCPSAADAPPTPVVDGDPVAVDSEGSLSLFIWKNTVEAHLGDVTYFKVRSGTLASGSDLVNGRTENSERFGTIYVAEGKKKHQAEALKAGDLGIAVKLKDATTNDTFYSKGLPVGFQPIAFPTARIRVAVKAASKNDEEKMGEGLHAIAQTDPTLQVGYRPDLKQTIANAQGEMHLANVKWLMKKNNKIDIDFVKPRISYRETIQGTAKADYRHKKQTGGSGQFAEVHLRMDPYVEGAKAPSEYKVRDQQIVELDTGGVLEFNNCIVGGAIDTRFIPSVLKGIMEQMREGPLTSSPVRDIRIILYDGKMHPVDSNEMAFKLASSQAFKDAFERAKPKLLEPIMDVEVLTPSDAMGDVMTDLQNRRSIIMGMDAEGNFQKLKARVPLAELYKYSTSLRSISQGRAIHTREFAEYSLVSDNVKDQIIKEIKSTVEE
ncbi:MAG: elongation factor G [Bacteroidota bacterium]